MRLRAMWAILRDTYTEFLADRVPRMGAALAFYMTFALAPLLLVVVAIAGLIFGRQAAEGQLFSELKSVVGNDLAITLQTLLSATEQPGAGVLASIVAGITVLVGALGVFIELQDALNAVLGIRDKPGDGFKVFVQRRLLAFLMVIAFGFLLLASLALSTTLTVVNGMLAKSEYSIRVPAILTTYFPTVVSFVIVTLVFAMIYRFLPDTRTAWRSVWFGSVAGSTLFAIGKSLFGLYLGHIAATSIYGAAASLIALMLWSYYTAQIILVGAEMMKLHARRSAE